MTKNSSPSLASKSDNEAQISENMLKLVENITNNSAAKESENPQQVSSQQSIDQTLEDEKSSLEQVAEQNEAPLKKDGELGKPEESPAQSAGNQESQDSVKKDEGFIVGMLKALIKLMGGTIDEDGKEEEKNKSNALDELRKYFFPDNSKGNVVESVSVIPLFDSQTPTQTPDSISNQNPAQAPAQTQNSTPDQNEEKGENNADKLITQLIVGLYEKEGKLDLLKEILKDERGKDENKNNPEMQKLIDGFDSQIAEVEKNREQAVDKSEVNDQGKTDDTAELEAKEVKSDELSSSEITNGDIDPVNSEEGKLNDLKEVTEENGADEPKVKEVEAKPEETVNEKNQINEVASNFVNEVINNALSESKGADNLDQVLSDQPEKEPEQGLENMRDEDNKLVIFKEGDLMDLEAVVAAFHKNDIVAEDKGSTNSSEPTTAISDKKAQEQKQGQGRE